MVGAESMGRMVFKDSMILGSEMINKSSETETHMGALQQQTEWQSLHPAGIFITESISENSELKFTTAKCGIANLELFAQD